LQPEKRDIFHRYSDKPKGIPQAFCYCYEEIFAEKLRALAERARPRDLYDIIHLYQARHRLEKKSEFFESLEQKCAFKKMAIPSLETIERHSQKNILSSEWDNMLKHQLPHLKPLGFFWQQLPQFFDWFYEDYPRAPLTQLKPFLGENKRWSCLVLFCEKNIGLPYVERYALDITGIEIIRLNQSGKVWCQPFSLIDVTRKGETKFVHDKLYEVILMYLDEGTKTFVSYDPLKRNRAKTSLENARAGDLFEVPGYFLNDWNNRINPSTGYVHYWFQPTALLPPDMKTKLILSARRNRV
jgi:hypothetical protein